MSNEQVFCGAEKCSNKCPAYDGSDFNIWCKIITAKINAEKAKDKAYKKIEDYYSCKIENDKISR